MEFLRKLFGTRSDSSAKEAKGRLVSVLIHDRTDISPKLLDDLRVEMIAILKKYMVIDESNIEINLDRGSRAVALVANVPVLRVNRGAVDYSDGEQEAVRTPRTETTRAGGKNRRHR